MRQSKTGFSIIFAIIILVLASTMSLYLLSFIIPYGRNVKGLENSTKAYYLGGSAVEQSLWEIKQNTLGYESSDAFSGASDYRYDIVANGNVIPTPGLGDSNFSSDWNIVGFNKPIQLSVGGGNIGDWGQVDFRFRVPDFDQNGDNTSQRIAGTSSTAILYWQLSSETDTLLPENPEDFITSANIDNSGSFTLSSKNGVDLNNVNESISAFYAANCGGTNPCILKISPVGGLKMLGSGIPIPYLEYTIDTGTFTIPTRFTHIHASGKSFGFRKDIQVNIPQLTTDQAFDFTVFQ